jgi:5-methyltetrahydropteroyltriglutamate--homocysteine methyltransferase
MFAREGGAAIDAATLDEAIERATAFVLDRQKQAGISVIGDGEMSKPSYATYIKHRLSGFGGEAGQYEFEDLERFPGAKARVFGDTGRARRSAPACTAPIEVIDMDAPREDAERLTRLAGGHETFMSAASPGVTALFFPNQFYASDEAYVFALAEACATNTRRSPRRGSRCRSIARTWRWAATCSSPTCRPRSSASASA